MSTITRAFLITAMTFAAVPALAADVTAPAVAPVAASAASAGLIASTKIAVVNIQSIMRDSTAAKSVREQLEAKQKSYQSEIAKKEETLQKEDDELAKQRTTLSKEAFDQKVKAFRDKATATQKEVAAKKAAWDNAYESSLAQIQTTVTQIIGEISKQKGFVVALPASQILYSDNALDISPEVLARLNQRLSRIDVKFEAPSAAAGSEESSSKKKKK